MLITMQYKHVFPLFFKQNQKSWSQQDSYIASEWGQSLKG